jgi:hypothetical protein
MKKSLKFMFITLMLLFAITSAHIGLAQEPPHPPSEKGSNDNHGPSGVPIDGGLSILLAMSAAYGALKMYQVRTKAPVTR